ncbi:SGNH/GDSL hydrolase family protein [Inhella sp.]|uniref:SGNH/GDSL hydrolase family protein n=1 Tax=Inhella sp. TaxID=1921806 RepID=UPI0035B1792F
MRQLLVYGDSLSWGIVPLTRERLPFEQRWPGVLEAELGGDLRVLEDCLNGRRTVFEDPYKAGRNGLQGLQQRIEAQSPLAGVLLMLGSNDWQSMHPHNAEHAAQGVATLVRAIRAAPIEPGMPVPPVLVIVPPRPAQARGPLAWKFAAASHKAEGLLAAYQAVCKELDCPCFDAGSVIGVSSKDGVHLDAEAHRKLGKALAAPVRALLN